MTPLARHARIPPLDHAIEAARLQADQGLRLTNAWLGGLRLLTKGGASWIELSSIGSANLQRLVELQVGWTRIWLEWLRYASQAGGAAGLSKLSERE
jgi:hypothetical protein